MLDFKKPIEESKACRYAQRHETDIRNFLVAIYATVDNPCIRRFDLMIRHIRAAQKAKTVLAHPQVLLQIR